MTSDPINTLRAFARQFKGRISPINLYDSNVCSWTRSPERSWESILVSGEPFLKQLRCTYREHKIRMFANHFFVNVEIAAILPIKPLSINHTNTNDVLLKPAEVQIIDERKYSTFTRSGEISPAHKDLMARNEFIDLVCKLDLQGKESLHFRPDTISVYFDHPSLSKMANLIDYLINLIQQIEGHEEKLDFTGLPAQFHPLIPLLKKWSIDDDSDREDFLAGLPKGTLRIFVSEVDPYLSAIDSYLDSFASQAPSEQAVALGRLAECAIEARQQLKEASSPDTNDAIE